MTGWTAPRTWVAAEVATAAIMNAHVRDNFNALNGYVLKTADQSVTSSTVLVNDNDLLYTIGSAGTYVFDAYLYGVSAADNAGDLKVGATFPTGTLHVGSAGGPSNNQPTGYADTASWLGILSATSGTSTIPLGLSATLTLSHIHGILIATATGTLRLQWAQLSSSPSASTLKAGSHLIVKQVA